LQNHHLLLIAESLTDQATQKKYLYQVKQAEEQNQFTTLLLERREAEKADKPVFLTLLSQLMNSDVPERITSLGMNDHFHPGDLDDLCLSLSTDCQDAVDEEELISEMDEEKMECFAQMNRRISLTYKPQRLKEILDQDLPRLGIHCASIFLFEGARTGSAITHLLPPEKARRFYSLESSDYPDRHLQFGGEGISLLRWVPQNCHRVLMPLAFEEELLGFVIMELNRELPFQLYENLRINLCSFLKGQELAEELKSLSLYDELTQLYNLKGFYTLGEQIINQSKRLKVPLALYYCDIDGLEKINQHRGREGGDQVLKEAASLLQSLFRKNDVVGRVGADEFAILAMGVSEENEGVIISRMESSLARFLKEDQSSIPFRLRTSVSRMNPEEPYTLRDMLTMAEFLMSEEKEKAN